MSQIDKGDYFIDPDLMQSLKVGVVAARKETIAQMGKHWVQELFEHEEI
eukprot:CAMPEP_0116875288 /NCGR_PEP_ID=MMETSP0463-20121206/7166_1 /TAXON_ID=181622 /ORGANISM="Strombidinopsis sp, Strain SopsisLIS2011" /LENGTH=48 /DNA_ID= /DNA_START= /DNA_END= /DNA_ORIENTATION=